MATTTGTSGNDNLVGGSGVDILSGGAGDDRLNGGSGDDVLNGGSGFDTVLGGSGTDTLIYKAYENQYRLGSTFASSTQTVTGGMLYSGTDQTINGIVPTQTLLGGTTFSGYDSYDGGNGAVQLGKTGSTPDVDTMQIWLSAAQFSDAAIAAEIAYVKNVWLPAHISAQTGQADSSVYTFKTLDLKITGIEQIVVLNEQGTTNHAPSTPTDSDGAVGGSVSEGAVNGSPVGITAIATDADGDTITYSLSDNAGGRFGINAITGVVTVANASLLNYETATSHTITVQASDGHGGITTQSFTIAVTDVAPSTPTDTNAAANTVAEGATAGTLVGVTASSSDVHGGTVTYSLSDDAGGRFQINSTTGVVSVSAAGAGTIDYESSGGSYTIKAVASDGTLTSASQTFTIAVGDVAPSVPTDGNAAANSVAEGATAGTLVGVTASSSDVHGGTVTYSLSDDAGGRFQINSTTGVVSVSAAGASTIDYESSGGSYTVKAVASDGTLTTTAQTFTIAVTDVDPSTPTDTDGATGGS
ncbi:cadherin domain-containing protein, partial [Mesorhizobium sp. M0761]